MTRRQAARSRTPRQRVSWPCSRQAHARTARTARQDRGKAVAQQRRGLGRGLGALIPEAPRLADGETGSGPAVGPALSSPATAGLADPADTPAAVPGAHYKEIPVSAITPNP